MSEKRVIKVKLHQHENDDYNELWKVISGDTKVKYFVRHTCYGGEWCFVSDPLGYCELDHTCPDNYEFVVCDQKNHELFRCSNAKGADFPCLRVLCEEAWKTVKPLYPAERSGMMQWLLTFLTKEKEEELMQQSQPCISDNWVYCWYDEVGHEALAVYEYVGEQHSIDKVKYKHRYCDVEFFGIQGAKWYGWIYGEDAS